MYEILIFGLLVLAAYFIAHHAVMALERLHGSPLGAWRMAAFFIIFLTLLLAAQLALPHLTGHGGSTP